MNGHGARWGRRFRLAAAVAVALFIGGTGTAASPDEDFRLGDRAYRAGDVLGAMAPLRRAADLGHAPAQALLGEILDRAEFNEEAVAYFRKAADQGNTDGEFGLGTMLLTGEGVARDPAMAMALFRRAAEKKHPDAIRALAQAHLADGGPGREPAEVLRWARAAAELDHLPSIDALVRAYRQGEYGATPDPKEAARWATRAQELRKVARSRKR